MKLPISYPKNLIAVVKKLDFEEVRQSGSHKTFKHKDGRILTIAFHSNKPIPPGLLNKIIKQDLGISREKFSELLQ